ncbi:hypothetical protein Tco_1092122 [Tanacetum coccineum]|uniref:Uncharacterized protein n=1 Tax=Tanacetum coccineum TaxID=301880 RepID=A0ABQ5IA74_9ASTR
MQTKRELTLEQTQQGVSSWKSGMHGRGCRNEKEKKEKRVNSFTLKWKPAESTSTQSHGRKIQYLAGNPVRNSILQLNLSDQENGNAPIVTKTVDGKEIVIPPISVEEKAQRRAESKARSTLLMALPNEHQLKFNSYNDAKILMQAIENRFGGFKKQISQLEMYGEVIPQEDINQNDTLRFTLLCYPNYDSQLDNEDYKKSIPEDLEETDLRWNIAMMTYEARRSEEYKKDLDDGQQRKNWVLQFEKPIVETNEPETSRKENGAPIIKDWVSDSDEENVPKVKIVEMFNKPSFAKINFVKSTEQVKSPRKTSVDKNRQNTPSPRGNKRN